MLLQMPTPAAFMITVAIAVIVGFLMFIIGVILTRWWAKRKDWDDSWMLAIKLNLVWLIPNILLYIIIPTIWPVYGILIAMTLSFIINLIIGTIVAWKLYEKELKESFVFILLLTIILGLTGIFVGTITTILVLMIHIWLRTF